MCFVACFRDTISALCVWRKETLVCSHEKQCYEKMRFVACLREIICPLLLEKGTEVFSQEKQSAIKVT